MVYRFVHALAPVKAGLSNGCRIGAHTLELLVPRSGRVADRLLDADSYVIPQRWNRRYRSFAAAPVRRRLEIDQVLHDEVVDAGLGWDRELLRTFACKSKRCVRIPGRAEKHT